MHQLQSIIDRIRIALLRERYEASAELQELSSDLHEQTRQVNERLRRCGEYLRRGLRAEAIHDAETEPRLLDCVAVLESFSDSERQAWLDVCEFLNLPIAEPILYDVAIMIDEAYSEHAPLDKLLRQHRRLALQRAPLSLRLKVVRKLAQQDPNSEHWGEDVARYEEARLVQIAAEAMSHKKSRSVTALNNLLEEVNSKDWKNAPPSKLIASIRALQREAVRNEAQATLESLGETLHQAYSEMNFEKAREAYAHWQEILPTLDLPNDDPVIARNLAALTWCREELERQASEKALESHLQTIEKALANSETSEESLRFLITRAQRFDRPLPVKVAARLNNRIRDIQARRSRRRMIIGVSTVVSSLSVVMVLVATIMKVYDASYRGQITQRIQEMIDRGEINQAAELVNQFDPRWAKDSAWIDTKSRFMGIQDGLATRESRMEDLFQQAEVVHDGDDKEYERLIEQAKLVANEKPVLDSIQQQFERRSSSLAANRQLKRTKREEQIATRIDAQGAELKKLTSQHLNLDSVEFAKQRDDIRTALEQLAKEPGLPVNQSTDIRFKLAQLQELDQQHTKTLQTRELYAELQKHSRIAFSAPTGNTIVNYTTTLNKGAETLNPSPIAAELKQSSDEAVAWTSLYGVQSVLPSEMAGMFPTDREKLKERRAELAKLLEENPLCPLRDAINQYIVTLGVLEERGNAVQQFLGEYLDLVKMSGLFVVQEETRSRPFYITEEMELDTKLPSVPIRAWMITYETREAKLARAKLKSSKPAPAPQKRLADQFRPCLGSLTYDNWEDICRQLVEATLQAADVDPILKLEILSTINSMALSGNPGLKSQKAFLDYVSQLRTAQSKIGANIDWADPTSEKVEGFRKSAQVSLDLLAKLDISKVWSVPQSQFTDVARRLRTRYEAVGFMRKDDDQRPQLDVTIQRREPCQIFASIPSENAAQMTHRLEVVGQSLADGRVKSVDALAKHFRTGRLVFAKTTPE